MKIFKTIIIFLSLVITFASSQWPFQKDKNWYIEGPKKDWSERDHLRYSRWKNKIEANKDVDRLTIIRDKIECFDKEQQIDILKILNQEKTSLNENKNGVFVNLTNLSPEVINKLDEYIDYIENQEKYLQTNEDMKQQYKDNYFKHNKDNSIVDNNVSGTI